MSRLQGQGVYNRRQLSTHVRRSECPLLFRWRPGAPDLPPHVLGHIGYSVVAWRQGRGYATRALAMLPPLCREQGLPYVDLTTTPDYVASQRVALKNGARLVRRFQKPAAYGGGETLLYRIDLDVVP